MAGLHPLGGRRRERPLWLTVILLIVAMAVVFGLGFGVATLIRGDTLPWPRHSRHPRWYPRVRA